VLLPPSRGERGRGKLDSCEVALLGVSLAASPLQTFTVYQELTLCFQELRGHILPVQGEKLPGRLNFQFTEACFHDAY